MSDSGVKTLGGTLTAAAGAFYVTYTDSTLAGQVVGPGQTVLIGVSLKDNVTPNNSGCMWVQQDYIPNLQAQVRS